MAGKNRPLGGQPITLGELASLAASQSPGDNDQTTVEDDLEAAEYSELLSALSEVSDTAGVRISVTKVLPKEEAGSCCTYAPGELTVERIREDWGPGKYTLLFKDAKGRIQHKRQLSIVGKKPPLPGAVASTDVSHVLREMDSKNQQSQMGLLQSIMQQQNQTMIALIGSMGNRTDAFGAKEMLAMIVSMKELFKSEAPSTSPIDTLVKGIELANKFGGGGSEPSILESIVKGLELARPLLENMNRAPQLPATEIRQIPRATAAHAVPHETNDGAPSAVPRDGVSGDHVSENDETLETSGEESMLDLIIWLREQISFLLQKAEQEKDPGLYADYVLDNLPPKITGEVVEAALRRPDWFEQLAMLSNKKVLQHVEWFAEFRESALEAIQEARSTQEDDTADVVESTENVLADSPVEL